MKISVDFFNGRNRKIDYLFYIKYSFIFIALLFASILFGKILLKNSAINNNILYFANNIAKAKMINVSKADFMLALNKQETAFVDVSNEKYKKKEETDKKEEVENKNSDEFDASIIDMDGTVATNTKNNLVISETSTVQKISVYGVNVLNYSSKKNMDILSMFDKNIVLTKKSDPILIYSTHTSESYTNSERYKFGYSSSYRTRDAKYNMLSVGSILSNTLKEKGMTTIFSTTPHDYGSYEIAYTNSRKTIENELAKNQRIGLAIDVHRDALGDLTNGPTVEINGQKVAKIMFVMGVGTDSYSNEIWEDNLALALQLQRLGEAMYPGLFRAMIVRNSRYNQDLIKHSFLIEIGTTGNTLEEAYFGARCLANILNKFYNN